ncbi:hypothetical protein [Intestinirhabdus alba]|nr:hypothetical protein [Intestinirhabdus alba]
MVWRHQRAVWQYATAAALMGFWPWRFIFRYQLCP